MHVELFQRGDQFRLYFFLSSFCFVCTSFLFFIFCFFFFFFFGWTSRHLWQSQPRIVWTVLLHFFDSIYVDIWVRAILLPSGWKNRPIFFLSLICFARLKSFFSATRLQPYFYRRRLHAWSFKSTQYPFSPAFRVLKNPPKFCNILAILLQNNSRIPSNRFYFHMLR